jgi:uncharacterized surface protein with fasciclin (FAS1) repeats
MSKHLIVATLALLVAACGGKTAPPAVAPTAAPAPAPAKKFVVPTDPNNIVSIAVGSKDHTTLVAALQAADYVTPVANPGPLTVFAPTNAAFEKLPKGTVESLVDPKNVEQLRDILKYHVTTSVYLAEGLKDGQDLGMANGAHAIIHIKDGKIAINDANVVASIRASNGVVHVIDGVLTPPAK